MTAGSKVEDLIRQQIAQKAADARAASAAATIIKNVEPEEKIERVKPVLQAGQKWASDVVGVNVSDDLDFPVSIFEDESWHEKIRAFIPSPRKNYVIQTDAALDILRAWQMKDRTLITGPTGAGKSTLAEHLCGLVRRPFVRVNATGDMDSSMVFGQLTARDGSTEWVDGVVTEAVRYGAVLAWDEWDVTPPEIMMGMQWLLEDEGKLFLKEMPGTAADKFITPHEESRVICLGNTLGQGDETGRHAGTTPQNTATLDRFGTCIHLTYLDPKHEATILHGAAKIEKKTVVNLIKFAGQVRTAYEQGSLSLTMSPRSLIAIAKKIEFGLSPKQATDKVYLNKLNTTQRRLASEFFDKVFGRV